MHAPAKTRLTREQMLLVASGLAAVAVVGWVLWLESGLPLLALACLLFAGLFLVSALNEQLGLPVGCGRWVIWALLLLNLVILAVFPYQVTLILAVVLAASAPSHLSDRESWTLLAVGNLLFWLILQARDGASAGVPGLLSLLALQGFAVSSSLARRRDELSRLALAAQNEELQAARAVLARRAQSEERLRIAGDLHDSIGHGLTALQLQLEALSHQAPAALRDQVTGCKAVAADLLEEVRAIVRDMRASASPDLGAVIAALEASTPGVSIRLRDRLPQLSEDLTQQLGFCFQEAVSNAIRHGGADRIEIRFADGRYLIEDNGGGLRGQRPRPGFGLRNINQRLALFGGHAALSPGGALGGCLLTLTLPEERAG